MSSRRPLRQPPPARRSDQPVDAVRSSERPRSEEAVQHEDDRQRLLHYLGERVKELTALHGTVRLLQDRTKPLEEVLTEVAALLPPAWQYPDIAVARIQFDGITVSTPDFQETPWMQRAPLATSTGRKGWIEVAYLQERPVESEGSFLLEERHLIDSLADSLSSYLTRREAEEGLRDAHGQLQALSRQLMQVQEQERRVLAHDLHDEVGTALTALKMNLQTMQRVADTRQVAETLNDSLGILDSLLKRIRDLSLDLRPSLLDDLGLVPAIRWYVMRQAERAGIVAHVDAEDLPKEPSADKAVVCFRIVQEAVTNVLRHANASRLDVTLRKSGAGFELRIKDNGVGFSLPESKAGASDRWTLGLLGMQERARALGGALVIRSEAGRGTEVRAQIPLENAGTA
ncbi:MAG: sensor histidine kinase [Nitrospira sp.]|jgi:signal transduction histidine kinase|nr:sensor histidine kinase [Nitrospira sp.]